MTELHLTETGVVLYSLPCGKIS